jgi:hypothetical protein
MREAGFTLRWWDLRGLLRWSLDDDHNMEFHIRIIRPSLIERNEFVAYVFVDFGKNFADMPPAASTSYNSVFGNCAWYVCHINPYKSEADRCAAMTSAPIASTANATDTSAKPNRATLAIIGIVFQ